jgi:hypothetical protein
MTIVIGIFLAGGFLNNSSVLYVDISFAPGPVFQSMEIAAGRL